MISILSNILYFRDPSTYRCVAPAQIARDRILHSKDKNVLLGAIKHETLFGISELDDEVRFKCFLSLATHFVLGTLNLEIYMLLFNLYSRHLETFDIVESTSLCLPPPHYRLP